MTVPTNAYQYPPASPEETSFRRILMGAILEFGEPYDFESGSMTRPLRASGDNAQAVPQKPTAALEYYMLQEDGQGYSIFSALRTTYVQTTPAEPVRLAVQFVTTQGTAIIDVAVPSRYEEKSAARVRSYDEKNGPRLRVAVLSHLKGKRLEDILLAFTANKQAPVEDFEALLAVIREQGETKSAVLLGSDQLKQLTEFIALHFGDFSYKVPVESVKHGFEEIIPESPAEVADSDGWMRGVAAAAEEARADRKQQS